MSEISEQLCTNNVVRRVRDVRDVENHDIYSNMYLFKAHVKHMLVMKYFIIVL